MTSTTYGRRGPNRLLQGMILVSLVIHVFVFMHIAGIYRSSVLQYIELALQAEPSSRRAIPRPPQLPKEEDEPDKEKAYSMAPIELPDVNKLKLKLGEASLSPGLGGGGGLSTRQDYYDMIRLRIERGKKYPDGAPNIEVTVVVGFVIQLDGRIRDLRIVKPCRYKIFNQAALQAVRDSTPFLPPPPRLFKDEFIFELNVNFEIL